MTIVDATRTATTNKVAAAIRKITCFGGDDSISRFDVSLPVRICPMGSFFLAER
jgi:hypothetical protein